MAKCQGGIPVDGGNPLKNDKFFKKRQEISIFSHGGLRKEQKVFFWSSQNQNVLSFLRGALQILEHQTVIFLIFQDL